MKAEKQLIRSLNGELVACTFFYQVTKYLAAASCVSYINLIVDRPLIAHLSLYLRLKPTCDKKIGIMGLVYIFN